MYTWEFVDTAGFDFDSVSHVIPDAFQCFSAVIDSLSRCRCVFLDVTQSVMSLLMTSGRIHRGSSYSADSEEGHRTDAECNLPQLMSLVGTTMYMFSRAFI